MTIEPWAAFAGGLCCGAMLSIVALGYLYAKSFEDDEEFEA